MVLADPDERPHFYVVIYDGHCRICTQSVWQLAMFDRSGSLAYLSLHDPRVAQRYPKLSYDQLMEQMWVVDPQGNQYGGVAAIRFLSCKLWLLWPLAMLLHLPLTGWFWTSCYRMVARFRYKLGGKTGCENGECSVHVGRRAPKE